MGCPRSIESHAPKNLCIEVGAILTLGDKFSDAATVGSNPFHVGYQFWRAFPELDRMSIQDFTFIFISPSLQGGWIGISEVASNIHHHHWTDRGMRQRVPSPTGDSIGGLTSPVLLNRSIAWSSSCLITFASADRRWSMV